MQPEQHLSPLERIQLGKKCLIGKLIQFFSRFSGISAIVIYHPNPNKTNILALSTLKIRSWYTACHFSWGIFVDGETSMLTGLYSAASGMIIQQRVQNTLAQNLAGSQSPGFRRQEVVVRSFPDVMLNETYRGLTPTTNKPRYNHAIGRVGTGAGVDWIYTDPSAGALKYTGNDNDMAIFGDGYFSVLTPDGLRFTRQGTFMVDKDGFLVTNQGHRVMGQGNDPQDPTQPLQRQPIQVGTDDFYVNHFGEVWARQPVPGQPMQKQNVRIDQLIVVDFENPDKLFREQGNLYRVEEGDQDNFTIPDRFQVVQGYVEEANTQPTTEMVKMIDSFRIFEASSRIIRSLDQTLQRAVNDVGRAQG